MNKKCIVIASGGLDSTTLLYWAKQKYQDIEVLTFDYGSKHNKREFEYAKYHCQLLSIYQQKITLELERWNFKSHLLKNGKIIPQGHYEADNMKQTVVPFRNGIMLSIACGYAESVGASDVLLGSHKGDRAQYKDCTSEFTQAISLASQLGTEKRVKIISPFNDLMKWDILKIGLDLNVNFSKTWSCYNGGKRPCLKCGTDVERTESFVRNGIKDPFLTLEEWNSAILFMKSVIPNS